MAGITAPMPRQQSNGTEAAAPARGSGREEVRAAQHGAAALWFRKGIRQESFSA